MPFVKILKTFGPYVEGRVHEVNENRRDRFLEDKTVEMCEGPATILPGSAEDRAEARADEAKRRAARKAGSPGSAATAATASPPGRKVTK